MTPKDYYKNYQADNGTVIFNDRLVYEIMLFEPNHVFEFGCGTGKNLALIQSKNMIPVTGLDISLVNVINSYVKNDIKCSIIGDETYLRHLCNYDVVFTCSVLDHIERVDLIVHELKRICNKAVVIGECYDHDPESFYFKHNYEAMGFEPVSGSRYQSPFDNHNYFIWKWVK